MKEYFSLEPDRKQEIIKIIRDTLLRNKNIVFSFVFGSFLESPSFRDIDVSVYVNNIEKEEIPDYELKLSKEISEACGLPIDFIEVKILNFAPIIFLNNIFNNGKLIFSQDYKLLTDLIENSSLEAISNEHIAYQSLKELVPSQ